EPAVPFGTHDFQSCPFGHSGTSPDFESSEGFRTGAPSERPKRFYSIFKVVPEERVGVEPTLDLRPNLISNQALSATQPPLQIFKRTLGWPHPAGLFIIAGRSRRQDV